MPAKWETFMDHIESNLIMKRLYLLGTAHNFIPFVMCRTFGQLARLTLLQLVLRIWIRDPGIRHFFDPQDLGSQKHIFESLVAIFWVKLLPGTILSELAQIFSSPIQK